MGKCLPVSMNNTIKSPNTVYIHHINCLLHFPWWWSNGLQKQSFLITINILMRQACPFKKFSVVIQCDDDMEYLKMQICFCFCFCFLVVWYSFFLTFYIYFIYLLFPPFVVHSLDTCEYVITTGLHPLMLLRELYWTWMENNNNKN